MTLGGVVLDMMKLWRPYDQSYFWAEPPKIMLGQRIVSSTLSSCRGHDPLAQHYFRRLCPKIWLGIGSPQFPHAVDNSPQSHEIVEPYFFRVSFLFPPPRDSLSEWYWGMGRAGRAKTFYKLNPGLENQWKKKFFLYFDVVGVGRSQSVEGRSV